VVSVIILIVVVGSAIWVAVDASNLGVKKGCLGGGLVDSGPVAWFFVTLLLWIIGFPLYLATRPKYVALHKRTGSPVLAAPTEEPHQVGIPIPTRRGLNAGGMVINGADFYKLAVTPVK
jgi:hypothetical protein